MIRKKEEIESEIKRAEIQMELIKIRILALRWVLNENEGEVES